MSLWSLKCTVQIRDAIDARGHRSAMEYHHGNR
jgi:hypothetical protein